MSAEKNEAARAGAASAQRITRNDAQTNATQFCTVDAGTQYPPKLILVLPDLQAWRGFMRSDHHARALQGARALRRALARQQRRKGRA